MERLSQPYVHKANVFIARKARNSDRRELVLVAVFLAAAVAHVVIGTLVAMPARAGGDFAHAAIAAVAVLGNIRVETVIKGHHGAVGGATKLR